MHDWQARAIVAERRVDILAATVARLRRLIGRAIAEENDAHADVLDALTRRVELTEPDPMLEAIVAQHYEAFSKEVPR